MLRCAVIASLLGALLISSAPAHAACAGDCDGDGFVRVEELVLALSLALSGGTVAACVPADVDGDQGISIADLIACVGNALTGCRPSPTPTPTPLPGVDLRPSDVYARGEYQSGCRGPLAYLIVCVENAGGVSSGPFAVMVQPGDDRFQIGDLGAQTRLCETRPFFGWEQSGDHTFQVAVDVDGAVAEVDEANNSETVQVHRPTIPVTCSPTGSPTHVPSTPTPSSTN